MIKAENRFVEIITEHLSQFSPAKRKRILEAGRKRIEKAKNKRRRIG